ncbi:hypothetical protein KKF91_11160 [Myxococcota bacterium]|nr:hypothetical protein [Myxococcota bacterium]MBU1431087.1 hypothetical protein [Myxococcota bacterium]MBU1896531.1 hypothetical protein [Myxococcota bacterium]
MKWLTLTLLSLAALGCLEDVEDPRPKPQPTLDGGAFDPGKKPPTGTGYGGSSGSGSTGSGSGAAKAAAEAWDA